MFFNKLKMLLLSSAVLLLSACGDNLLPTDSDKQEEVVAGSIGHLPTQKAADFTLTRVDGADISLYDYLQGGAQPADAVLVYFTMWCSTCAAHVEGIANKVMPEFTGDNVRYLVLDFVSGSVSDTMSINDISASKGFEVLSDYQNIAKDQLHGSMGVTVVIDGDGTILYNQDYGNGSKIIEKIRQALAS